MEGDDAESYQTDYSLVDYLSGLMILHYIGYLNLSNFHH